MASAGRNTAVMGGTGTTSTPANNIDGRKSSDGARRPSQEGSLFSGLMHQKRGSQDATAQARRKSFADQAPPAGFIGNMWNNFTRGAVDAEKK